MPARPTRRALLVFAEGELTEEDYLNFWRRRFRRQVTVNIDEFHGTPLALVQHAIEAKLTEEKMQKRRRGWAHDEVWCIFDVDSHPHLEEARTLAGSHGINLAISNPCIELWFVLHFAEQTAYIDRRSVQRLAKEHLKCGKELDNAALEKMADGFEAAKARARALEAKHVGDATPAPGNPSSDVWRIVDSIASPAADH